MNNKKLVSWFVLIIVLIAAVSFFFWLTNKAEAQTWVYHPPQRVVVHAPAWTYVPPPVVRYRTTYRVVPAPRVVPYYSAPPIVTRYPTPVRTFLFGAPTSCISGY